MDRKRLAALVVCALVLLAGCGSGPTGDNGTNATTGEPAETTVATNGTNGTNGTSGGMDGATTTATPGEGNVTDGNGTGVDNATNATDGTTVSDAGDLDAAQVRATHLRVLTEAGSASVLVDTSVRSGGTEQRRLHEELNLDFENGTTYRQRSVTVDNETNRTVRFTENGTTYVRVQSGGEEEYRVLETPTVNQTEAAALAGAFPAVAATNWTRNGVVTRDGENVTRYAAHGADKLDSSALTAMTPENASVGTGDARVTGYSAVLFVREDGSIRRYKFDLTVESGGEAVTISRNYRVFGIGSTGVSTPGWVELARQRAGGNTSG